MKIGVLETGAPPADLAERYGRYGAMFQALVGDKAHEWTLFDVAAGDLPAKPEVCEAYLITGLGGGRL